MTCALTDRFGRTIRYLRLSVTDRCDLRCVYCMAEDMQFVPKRDLLTLEELDRLASAFVARGVNKIRITGGEPLVRKDIMALFRSLSRHLQGGAPNELTLTTNATQLAQQAESLAAVVVLQALHAFSFGAAHLGAMACIGETVPASLSATAQSLYSGLVWGAGLGLMLLASGWLYQGLGGSAYLAMAAVALAGTCVALRLGALTGAAQKP